MARVLLSIVAVVGITVVIGYCVPGARAQGAADAPPGFWPEFWSAAKAAGFFGTAIMALMWWRAEQRAEIERQERIQLQKDKDAQTTETNKTLSSVAVTLAATREIVEKIVAGFDAMKDMIRDLRAVRETSRSRERI